MTRDRLQDLIYCKTVAVKDSQGNSTTGLLLKDIEGVIDSIWKEMIDECKWESSQVECDICGHKWVAVRPDKLTRLECPNCHYITLFDNI